MQILEDVKIQNQDILINPSALITQYPITSMAAQTVGQARNTVINILNGHDPRLLVVVGPCSIHDTKAALEYATLLSEAATRFVDDLFIVMRVYFEKPRTTLGWKGLISDPGLDGTYDVNNGLQIARNLLLKINNMGLPTATEFLDPFTPHYLHDLISWCAVGARTSESQIHRELASALPMPVGFKNNTDGNIQVAIDGIHVATQSHPFVTINKHGSPSVMRTKGNDSCHLVLRGSNSGPNFTNEHVQFAIRSLKNANLLESIIIDCSHGNCMKLHALQKNVIIEIINQIQAGVKSIRGVMLESNLIEGKQALTNKASLVYGQSITDACIGWDDTIECLNILANRKNIPKAHHF